MEVSTTLSSGSPLPATRPPEFARLLYSWYTDLSATISTAACSTAPVPLDKGVYIYQCQHFLTVINTLSITLSTREDLKYSSPPPCRLYANDACQCVISNTSAGCHHLLDNVQHWLEWVQMKAMVPKCPSMVIHEATGKRFDQNLFSVVT